MDYAHLPILVDLSNAQAGADLNQMSSVVDTVIIKMGEGNPAGDPLYDASFAIHVDNAYHAQPKRLPAGAYYVLNTNQYSGMTLDALKTMTRQTNPNYIFIQKTLLNKAINFIAIVMSYPMAKDNSSNQWLMQDLDTLYRNLKEGMKASEIVNMPIVVCTNDKYVNTYFKPDVFYYLIQNHEVNTVDVTKNAVQVWVQDYTQMKASQDTWANIRKYVPVATATPNTVLNGIPSWFLWQIGSTMFPKTVSGPMMYFSLNMSFVALDRLYAWMGYTGGTVVTPPPDTSGSGITPPTGTVDLTLVNQKLDQINAKLDKLSWLNK